MAISAPPTIISIGVALLTAIALPLLLNWVPRPPWMTTKRLGWALGTVIVLYIGLTIVGQDSGPDWSACRSTRVEISEPKEGEAGVPWKTTIRGSVRGGAGCALWPVVISANGVASAQTRSPFSQPEGPFAWRVTLGGSERPLDPHYQVCVLEVPAQGDPVAARLADATSDDKLHISIPSEAGRTCRIVQRG